MKKEKWFWNYYIIIPHEDFYQPDFEIERGRELIIIQLSYKEMKHVLESLWARH